MKRKVFFPILAAAIIGSVLASSNMVFAQNTAGSNSLVAAIAAKFNLNQSDVQAVFDEQREKHQAEMQIKIEEKLTKAVAEGKITEAQKQAILAKHQEMQNNRPDVDEMRNMTAEQRNAKMEERKSEMNTWLSANGLSQDTFRELMGGPQGKGGRGMMMKP